MRMTPEDWEEIDRETGLDKFWDNLEELLREVGKHPSRDGQARMLIPDKVQLLDSIYEVIKGEDSTKSIDFSQISSFGYVSARGTKFLYDKPRLRKLSEIFEVADNFDITPHTDGTIEVSFGVKGATQKLN